jgi:hypothetical protein
MQQMQLLQVGEVKWLKGCASTVQAIPPELPDMTALQLSSYSNTAICWDWDFSCRAELVVVTSSDVGQAYTNNSGPLLFVYACTLFWLRIIFFRQ